jgi:hypothetical protein
MPAEVPRRGVSAIDEICRMTLDFHAQSRAESGTTVSVSVINRGIRMNVATHRALLADRGPL